MWLWGNTKGTRNSCPGLRAKGQAETHQTRLLLPGLHRAPPAVGISGGQALRARRVLAAGSHLHPRHLHKNSTAASKRVTAPQEHPHNRDAPAQPRAAGDKTPAPQAVTPLTLEQTHPPCHRNRPWHSLEAGAVPQPPGMGMSPRSRLLLIGGPQSLSKPGAMSPKTGTCPRACATTGFAAG